MWSINMSLMVNICIIKHCMQILSLTLQVISSIDIQSIEPVDQKMRDSLTKSVQLAIEISTK